MRTKKLLVLAISSAMLLFLSPVKVSAQGPMAGNPTSGKLAVTPAGYDDMESVLKAMGLEPEQIQEQELADLSKLKQYSAVYINCSSGIEGVAESAAGAIRQYVQEGGVIYASDFADVLISRAFPGKIKFYSTGEGAAASSHVGSAGYVTANVTDAGIAAALGKSTIEINYDLAGWAVIQETASRVYMTGPATVMDYSTMPDLSNIDYSNPESLENLQNQFQTKSIGDVPYVVSFSEGNGEVLYTSFHNEAQPTADVKNVLNWFAVRVRASNLARSSRNLAIEGGNTLLQEVVDSLKKGETKTYNFEVTKKADLKAVLNFSGSKLALKISDSSGKEVLVKEVGNPPLVQNFSVSKGKYKMTVQAVDIPEDNYPFVVVFGGPNGAIAQANPAAKVSVSPQAFSNILGGLASLKWLAIGIGGVVVLAVIIIVLVLVRRKKSKI